LTIYKVGIGGLSLALAGWGGFPPTFPEPIRIRRQKFSRIKSLIGLKKAHSINSFMKLRGES
jgi:hypothetical protein